MDADLVIIFIPGVMGVIIFTIGKHFIKWLWEQISLVLFKHEYVYLFLVQAKYIKRFILIKQRFECTYRYEL